VRILKGLRADDFGQNTMKRGVGLEVLILMEREKRKYRRLRRLVEEVEERRIPASAGKPDLAGKPAGWDDIAADFPT
jgi:hypothetical protein